MITGAFNFAAVSITAFTVELEDTFTAGRAKLLFLAYWKIACTSFP